MNHFRPTIGPLVQSFFTHHLHEHKRVSSRTVASYRDTLKLLFVYVKDHTGKEPGTLQITDLDAPSRHVHRWRTKRFPRIPFATRPHCTCCNRVWIWR